MARCCQRGRRGYSGPACGGGEASWRSRRRRFPAGQTGRSTAPAASVGATTPSSSMTGEQVLKVNPGVSLKVHGSLQFQTVETWCRDTTLYDFWLPRHSSKLVGLSNPKVGSNLPRHQSKSMIPVRDFFWPVCHAPSSLRPDPRCCRCHAAGSGASGVAALTLAREVLAFCWWMPALTWRPGHRLRPGNLTRRTWVWQRAVIAASPASRHESQSTPCRRAAPQPSPGSSVPLDPWLAGRWAQPHLGRHHSALVRRGF